MKDGAVWLQMGTIGIEWTERLEKSATEVGPCLSTRPYREVCTSDHWPVAHTGEWTTRGSTRR